jgi:hypothetical protein
MLRRIVSQKYEVVEGHLGMSEVHVNEVEIPDLQGNNGFGSLRLRRLADGELERVFIVFLLEPRQPEINLDTYKRILLRAVDALGQPVAKARISLGCHYPTEEWPTMEVDTLEDGQLHLLTFPGTFRLPVQFHAAVGRSPHIVVLVTPSDPPERSVFLTVA